MIDDALDATGVVVGASVVVALVGTDGGRHGFTVGAGKVRDATDHRREHENADEHDGADAPRPLTLDDLSPRSTRHRGCLQVE